MSTWAILSDIHGRADRLRRALADAKAQGATNYLSLGDIGSMMALEMLEEVGASFVFGNWEASGLRGLPQPYRSRISQWPPCFRAEGFWAAHASPVWPDGLQISDVVDYLRTNELWWPALFPSLLVSEEARWAALIELQAANVHLFFHGHTHIQQAWCWSPDGMLSLLDGPSFTVPDDGSLFLVGVGSVGDARDGGGACYALYDTAARLVTWRRA
jgi:predicted phosphodiesterase